MAVTIISFRDRKSTRLNSSHTVIYTLSLHDALPISHRLLAADDLITMSVSVTTRASRPGEVDGRDYHFISRSEEHTSELQSHSDLHSFPTRRSSDLPQAFGGRRPDHHVCFRHHARFPPRRGGWP